MAGPDFDTVEDPCTGSAYICPRVGVVLLYWLSSLICLVLMEDSQHCEDKFSTLRTPNMTISHSKLTQSSLLYKVRYNTILNIIYLQTNPKNVLITVKLLLLASPARMLQGTVTARRFL